MKRILSLLLVLTLGLATARAEGPVLQAMIAKDSTSLPADTFAADVPQLFVFFRSMGTRKDDLIRGVWMIDDVGKAAPPNSKIKEINMSANKDNCFGSFSLGKPQGGWPVGRYHVDIYVGTKLLATVGFRIEPAGI